MPRPKHKRLINNPPVMEGFKPFGIPIRDLEPVILLFEEYNSIRLCDYEGMTQEQAAIEMGISRPTFTRVYEKARRSIAKAFVEGKAIFIEGGDFKTDFYWYRCNNCMKVIISKTIQNSCNYCRGNLLKQLNKPAE